ncbi:MAG: CHAT domain-containing protein [Bacteroidetes bacterium]|nr:CHAT domain-containing protein [Bacteroidota bacterium]
MIKYLVFLSIISFSLLQKNIYAQEWKELYLQSIKVNNEGDISKALFLMKQAKNLADDSLDNKGINYTIILSYIGQFCNELGRYNEAEKYLSQALTIRENQYPNEWKYLATSYDNLSNLYFNLGQLDKAEILCLKAIVLRREKQSEISTDYIRSINNLSSIYRSKGQELKADSLLKIVKKNQGDDLNNQINYLCSNAIELLKSGKFKLAEEKYEKALNLLNGQNKKDNFYINILNNLGFVNEKMQNYTMAESLYIEALSLTQNTFGKSHPQYAKILSNLSSFYFDSGNLDKSEEYFLKLNHELLLLVDKYFPTLNENERKKFWNLLKNYINKFNFFSVSRFQTNPQILCEMYNNQIATKGLLLNSVQKEKNKIRSTNDPSIINLYSQIQSLKQEFSNIIISSENNIVSENNPLDSLDELINEKEHELSGLMGSKYNEDENEKINWKDIQLKLKPAEAAIEIIRFQFMNTDTIFYAALILTHDTKNYPEIVINENGYSLENIMYPNYIKSITNSFDDDLSYDQFWKDIDLKLNGIRRIYISSDGVYNKINLNTLKDKENKFLIDKYDIVIVSNTDEIITKTDVKSQIRKYACLMGNPNYNLSESQNVKLASKYYKKKIKIENQTQPFVSEDSLKELKGSEKEINEIEKILHENNWQVEKYLKDNAIEEVIKSIENPFVLHIATHGGFSNLNDDLDDNAYQEDYPLLRSVLYFAGANRSLFQKNNDDIDDGILTALEATNLNLDSTELVVLSACETAKGKVVSGEGVYGLQRAFQIAGAKSIIMSLWKIDDEITQELMVKFYKKWIHGDNKFEAFKSAQLEIKNKYPNPYYWGAFIMVGI